VSESAFELRGDTSRLELFQSAAPTKAFGSPGRRLPALPWRDPHSVSPEQLNTYIAKLEQLCETHPSSSDLRTCLGMAHAMNFDVYKSMDAFERAVELDPGSFIAQIKYAELLYRIRALQRAEEETITALDLCEEPWELVLARRQLQEIRRLRREGTQKPEWSKTLTSPAVILLVLLLCSSVLIRIYS
jgi:cytochrome c-type biogenesis protein CcmH/NrfG